MPWQTVHFIGLLANCDSSILRIPLEHGFSVQEMSSSEAIQFIQRLEGRRYQDSLFNLAMLHCIGPSNKAYVIKNHIKDGIEIEKGHRKDLSPAVTDFIKKCMNNYLIERVFPLMRLFSEGNIVMPLAYFYYREGNTLAVPFAGPRKSFVTKELYTIKEEKVAEIVEFVSKTEIPFKRDFLRLAFDTFGLSYLIPSNSLSFLVLMMSLEALLNPGGGEIRYRLSRNTAVLTGTTKDNSRRVFCEMTNLYDKRSDIIHGRKGVQIKKEELRNLGFHVRESIKEVCNINEDKTPLMCLLNSCGFGERPWRG